MIEVKKNRDFSEFLDSLLEKSECDDLEFKSAAGGFPESFWETYSAFANTEGGIIVFGVVEKQGQFYLDGLTKQQVEKYNKDFWNNVNNKSTISCNLMKSGDVVISDFNGFFFMIFFVPMASREQRPVYRTQNPYNGTFKRNYEGDYKCTDKEVRRMFADADTSCPADSRILDNFTMEDIDTESVQQYRRLFAIAKPDHPWLVESDFGLISKLGGYRKDRSTNKEGFTIAGLLMFGKYSAITDVSCCPNFFPDYQEKLSDNSEERWTNRIYPDGTWEANLFQFFRIVLPRLQAVLPKPFKLEGNIRKDDTPAHVAVREALINSIVHADYSENASLIVRLSKNNILFSNPGTMLVSKQQYYIGGDSVCRNKSLQTMFLMLGASEKAGSGVDKILKGWKEQHWRKPQLVTKYQPDKVELTLQMESVIDDHVKERLVALFGESILYIGHDYLLVLTQACTDGYVTNMGLRYVLSIHKSAITELLKDMCNRKLLVAKGYGRGTKYFLPDAEAKEVSSEAKDVSSEVKEVSSEVKEVSSEAKEVSSEAKEVSSEAKEVSSEVKEVSSQRRRLKPQELDEIILYQCMNWMSPEELSKAVGRSSKYIRGKIIPRLLKEGRLEMKFPDTPNHPKQKYRQKAVEE